MHYQNNYQDKTIIVTGAAGYLGSRFVQALLNTRCHIIRLSRTKCDPAIHSIATITDIQVDFSTFDDWMNVLQPVDYIFHFAAQTGVAAADNNPVRDAQINVIGTLKILEAAKELGNKVIVFASAATICGLQSSIKISETVIDQPVTLYDFNKLINENYIRYFCEKNWIKGVSLRLANVYGPGVKSSEISRGVLNQVIKNALLGKDPVTYCGGEFIRDYIYIDDVINAFLAAGVYIDSLNGKYFLIGSSVGTTIKNTFSMVIDRVKQKTGISLSLKNLELPNGLAEIDSRNFIADSTAFSSITDWHHTVSLQQGIEAVISDGV